MPARRNLGEIDLKLGGIARPLGRFPDTERRALSSLQQSRFRVDERSASTISLAADTVLAAATRIRNCCTVGAHIVRTDGP